MVAAPAWPRSLLLLGCGNMGGAMLAGWLAGGMPAERFTILDPALIAAPDGAELVRDAAALHGRRFDAVVLGIKPQALEAEAPTIADLVGGETVVLSMLAGVECATLAALFPRAAATVRIMPNLAAAIGRSPIALASPDLDEARRGDVTGLMQPLGSPEWLDEALFDAFTALAGSGPAFVYRTIDALAKGGEALGLARAQADRMALAMVEGAALLAAGAPDSPGVLADRVASPGGTTRAGLDVLDADRAIDRLFTATLTAAAERSAEMAAAMRRPAS